VKLASKNKNEDEVRDCKTKERNASSNKKYNTDRDMMATRNELPMI
jgi:hypothetical protein